MKRIGILCLYAASLPFGQGKDLDLHGLIAEALERNPEILAAQKLVEAARKRPDQASALPETMFTTGYSSNGRPWPGAGLGTDPTSNVGLMISQEIPFPGKRKLRGDIAAKDAQSDYQQYQAIRLSVVARVKLAFYRLAHAHLVTDLIVRNRQLLTQLLRIAEVRYSVGKAAQQDILKAQTQLAILEARMEQQVREQAAREAELLALLNRPPTDKLEGHPPPMNVTHPTKSLEELYAAASKNSPTLQRDQKMIERSQLSLNLARKDFYPDYTITGGYFNMGSMPDMYQLQVSFKLPTSFSRKQRPAVAEQVALGSQARNNMRADSQSLAYRIKDEYLTWQTSNRLAKLYADTVVPQSNLTLESSLASYQAGTVDFLTVMMNFISILEYEMNYHEEMLNGHLAAARLEELTGVELTHEVAK